jgi:hypothetical protein
MGHCAAGELARLRRPQAGQAPKDRQYGRRYRQPTMALNFNEIFAREGAGCNKPQEQHLVDPFATR